jgi:hypothetical protein
MAQTAAHLVDHVIPPVPVRQWVISVPKRLRCFLADRPNAVAALTRIFISRVERLLCTAAGPTRAGDRPSVARPRLGAVSFLHRFGSALNHHVHLHACATDGVFVPTGDGPSAFRALAELFSAPRAPAAILCPAAVTALAIGNVGTRCDAATDGHAVAGHAACGDATADCCDSCDKPPSHNTSRIAWAKLMARVGEEFPVACPGCGGDIRLIAFITDPGPIRKVLTHLGEPLEPPPVSPARGPPTDWGELVQVHDDRAIFQGRIDELPDIDIHSL